MKRNKNTPLVSVIMPVYNAGEFLVESIESILNQTYKNIEFIIVDDMSSDNSSQIIAKYAKKYPRKIKFIQLSKNLGSAGDAAFNEGYKHANGEYIAKMDADDVAHPRRIEKEVKYLETNKDCDVVGTSAYVINRSGEVTGEKLVPQDHIDIRNNYFIYHPMIHPTVMYRRSSLPKRKVYDLKYSPNDDYYNLFKMIACGKRFANLTDKLLYYRSHDSNSYLTRLKLTFRNTFWVRLEMVFKYGYRPTLKGLGVFTVQSMTIPFMPESFIRFIFPIVRSHKMKYLLTVIKVTLRKSYQIPVNSKKLLFKYI